MTSVVGLSHEGAVQVLAGGYGPPAFPSPRTIEQGLHVTASLTRAESASGTKSNLRGTERVHWMEDNEC